MQDLSRFAQPGLVAIQDGQGGLPKLRVTTSSSAADVYLHGAQVTAFQKHGEAPLLFLGQRSQFKPDKAIRGGIPVCCPWFGPRPNDVSHGFARITNWMLRETAPTPGGVRIRLQLPPSLGPWESLVVELTITIAEYLELELRTTNTSRQRRLEIEACLHSYFKVGNIHEISVVGLRGFRFMDHVLDQGPSEDSEGALRITAQTDRTYLDADGPVEILDSGLHRRIRIEKRGSASTVVWNPWTTQVLPDLAPGEHEQFVCVESGNVGRNRLVLAPEQTATMQVRLTTGQLD